MQSKIEWRPLRGYETSYIISEYGSICSLEEASAVLTPSGTIEHDHIIVKPKPLYSNQKGYKATNIAGRVNLVHRLVAATFLANPNNYPIVNHIDFNRTNNHYSNLEWCTQKHNFLHSYKSGRMRRLDGTLFTEKPVLMINVDGSLVKEFQSATQAARELNLKKSGISGACLKYNGTKTYAGYKWEFVDKK